MTGRQLAFGLVAAVLIAVGLALGGVAAGSGVKSRPAKTAATARPNIVFILTDDLSWNLMDRRFAPHIVQLERQGETFTRYFVADSLCCPSRSTIFTGLFPHDTKVFTNIAPAGGFLKFQSQGLDRKTYALAVQRRGYATSMLGKYLNGYGDPNLSSATAPIPPGWSDWHVVNHTGYKEFRYVVNDNGTYDSFGGPTTTCGAAGLDDNYGVDVLNRDANAFITQSAARGRPFAMEVATFAPHKPYTPAPRNACDFPDLTEPRDASFDTNNVNPPAWLGDRQPMTPAQIAKIDQSYRMRAQSVEAVDRLLADVEATLAADHELGNTYIVFSSDNGYHMGQHRLLKGKQTAFDTDVRVPLIIAGPGVPHGKVMPQVTQNVDLYPTFVQLAGSAPGASIEGHSLVPLLHPGKARTPWRVVALIEHRHQIRNKNDPDLEDGKAGGSPTTYEAIRISARRLRAFKGPVEAVYVEYRDKSHEREYYDIRRDPFERVNIAKRLTAAQRRELHGILTRLERCHGGAACWTAGLPS